jgi:H+/Cl- antiporter ClcA
MHAGVTIAFAAPVSGMVFIAEESAANLGPPIYYRALVANCIALLVLNILTAAYHNDAGFWDTRCVVAQKRGNHCFFNVCLNRPPLLETSTGNRALGCWVVRTVLLMRRLLNQLSTSTANVLGLFYMWLWDLPIIVVASACIGMLGALFVALNTRLVLPLRRRFSTGAHPTRC